jgi:hypothetical protein
MKRFVFAIVGAWVLAVPTLAVAAGTLDQKQETVNSRLSFFDRFHGVAQTFTAGMTPGFALTVSCPGIRLVGCLTDGQFRKRRRPLS